MVKPGNVKQLFAYFGGKQAVASRLVPMIPEHELFVELFAGGLAVFFRKTNAKFLLLHIALKRSYDIFYYSDNVIFFKVEDFLIVFHF